jgi:hypothetical protein
MYGKLHSLIQVLQVNFVLSLKNASSLITLYIHIMTTFVEY